MGWILPEGTEVKLKKQKWAVRTKINVPSQIKINNIIYTYQVFQDDSKLEELGIQKEE